MVIKLVYYICLKSYYMKFKVILLISVTLFIATSCGIKKGFLKFDKRNDEVFATSKIKEFMRKNPRPSIVLRVPNTNTDALQSDQNSYIYTAIEKELLKADFDLKDRGLFNQVVNSQQGLDYSKISQLTGTDLILELVKINPKISISTNKAYTKDGIPKLTKDFNYTRDGASIEFKIIIVKNNDFGGSYTFNYTPCQDDSYLNDCNCQVGYKKSGKFYSDIDVNFCDENEEKPKKKEQSSYQTIPQDLFESFVREGVKKVIASIKD